MKGQAAAMEKNHRSTEEMAQQQKVDGIATSDSQHCALCTSTGPIHTLMMP
jgi:hypothetical protein